MTSVRLRPAAIDDLRVLEHWDRQPHVIAAGGDDDVVDWAFELTRSLPWRVLWIAELDARPIGLIQVIDPAAEETHYWGDIEPGLRAIDIWIGESDDLGKGYGTEMMRLSLAACFAEPEVEAVLVDPLAANAGALRFYERLGFVAVGPRTFGGDACIVYRLDRERLVDGRPD